MGLDEASSSKVLPSVFLFLLLLFFFAFSLYNISPTSEAPRRKSLLYNGVAAEDYQMKSENQG